MKTRLLATTGSGEFVEVAWEKPQHKSNEISVKALMTGVCRSDIDMMQGNFGPLPLHMQGHEGLAEVCEVGAEVLNVKVGDIVATRGEPAYADYYNVRDKEFVVVPEASPKYILEPVACGVNLVKQNIDLIRGKSHGRCLIVGSGFLAWVAYNTIKLEYLKFETLEVWGSSNKDLWQSEKVLVDEPSLEQYDVIIDIREHDLVLKRNLLAPMGIWVIAAEKQPITTTFSNLLWNANTIVMPSPRHPRFYDAMQEAKIWIKSGSLNIDRFWTRGYDRDTEWRQAFEDGINRPKGYSRGYIVWK